MAELSLDQAVQRGLAAALRGDSVIETASLIWDEGLDEDAVDACGRQGLALFIHAKLTQQRHPIYEDAGAAAARAEIVVALGGPSIPPVAARPHAARLYWQRILAANYETADGTRKPLLAFTIADVAYLRAVANARADGYLRLRSGLERAALLLNKHRKATIQDLPERAQQAIAEALR